MIATLECSKVGEPEQQQHNEGDDGGHGEYLGVLGGSGVHQQHDAGGEVAEDVHQEDDTHSQCELVFLFLSIPDLRHVV